ncbi:hypothetical protein PG987_009754 [Apiospora arundinis]
MKSILIAIVVGSATAAPAVKRQGFIPPNWGFPPGWGDPSLQPSPTCEFWPLGVSPTATPTVDGDGTAQPAAAALPPCVFPWPPGLSIFVSPGLGGPTQAPGANADAPTAVPTVETAPTPATWVA